MRPISRRTLLGISPLALASCANAGAYFGKTNPPRAQRLVYEIGGEPETLDPAKSGAGAESRIIPSLFEALVFPHPRTSQPLAGIATHYESDSDHTRFTFYLRGHPKPRGIRLPDTDSLRRDFLTGKSVEDFSRGRPASSYDVPARWSDGAPIGAHDFVYFWRRAIDPVTACPFAVFLYYVRHAEEINAGKRPPADLGVSAVDDFTLYVEMRPSTPFFLNLQEDFAYYAVPRHAVEAARRNGTDWTSPERIVTGGAFTVTAWVPYDHVTLAPNPHYYDADLVALREVVLLPVVSGAANLNIYKAGEADAMLGTVITPSYIPMLRSKKDFEAAPAYWSMFYSINTRRPPFDNILVRYALNMAIDKSGVQFDVLSYDPDAARQLLDKAGVRHFQIDILYPALPSSQDVPQILQQQLSSHLDAGVVLHIQEQSVCIQNRNALQYSGIAERGWWGDYLDPNTFLEAFLSGPSVIGTGWSDPKFDLMLGVANTAPGAAERMSKLAECEKYLLRAMPVLPLYYNVQTVLKKPNVRGRPAAKVDSIRFKYAWIDTNWRPS